MINKFPGGVWPTMLTPFTKNDEVDYPALEQMVNWYIQNGVSGLFAVCQSSEMFNLTLEERVNIARWVKEKSAGRVPVIASGHVSDSLEEQAKELNAIADTGVDAIILITNRLAAENEDDTVLLNRLNKLMDALPSDMPLGFYECPYPYKRLLSPDIMRECAKTGRFFFHKDTCCDNDQIREKLAAIKGTNFKLYNANTTTLQQSLLDGAVGYSGVMANFHPELYVWLCNNYESPQVQSISDALTMCSLIERQLYPVNAKYAMQLSNIDLEIICRTKNEDDFSSNFEEEVKALMRMTQELKNQLKKEDFS